MFYFSFGRALKEGKNSDPSLHPNHCTKKGKKILSVTLFLPCDGYSYLITDVNGEIREREALVDTFLQLISGI